MGRGKMILPGSAITAVRNVGAPALRGPVSVSAIEMNMCIWRIILCCSVLTAGCGGGKSAQFLPIENGFGYVGHSQGFTDRKSWAGLQYRDALGKTINVWGYLSMASPVIQITNNRAVFVGGVYDAGTNRFNDRLIAFDAPNGPPTDITEEILRDYCVSSGVDRTNIVQNSFVSLKNTNDSLRIDFVILKTNLRGAGSIDSGDGTEIIPWRHIESIMADVKKNGKAKTESYSKVLYLKKE
ncbi:MAG: hypothetical protein ACXWDN_08890 [Limisphaerales bacterium]